MTRPATRPNAARRVTTTAGSAVLALAGFAALTGASFSTASAAEAASFRCWPWLNAAEKTVCRNAELSRLDDELNTEYRFGTRQLSGNARNRLRRDQRAWLKHRDRCGRSIRCLRTRYYDRIAAIVEWDL